MKIQSSVLTVFSIFFMSFMGCSITHYDRTVFSGGIVAFSPHVSDEYVMKKYGLRRSIFETEKDLEKIQGYQIKEKNEREQKALEIINLYLSNHPNIDVETKKNMLNFIIKCGMNQEQIDVLISLGSIEENPSRVWQKRQLDSLGQYGEDEIWMFGYNDKLTDLLNRQVPGTDLVPGT